MRIWGSLERRVILRLVGRVYHPNHRGRVYHHNHRLGRVYHHIHRRGKVYRHNHRAHYRHHWGRVRYRHDCQPWRTLIFDNNALQLFRLSSHLLSRLNNRLDSSSEKDMDNDPNYQGTGCIINLNVDRLRDMVVRVSTVIRGRDSIRRRRRSRVRIIRE